MMTVTCKMCGKKIVWDDFKAIDFKCPRCGERLNMHQSIRENIERREQGEALKLLHCPGCDGIVNRLWFIRCPHCKQWLFGGRAISGKWFVTFIILLCYIFFSLYYFIYIH